MRAGNKIQHKNGGVYEVVIIANESATKSAYPVTVVYRNIEDGKVWARPLIDMDRSFKLLKQ